MMQQERTEEELKWWCPLGRKTAGTFIHSREHWIKVHTCTEIIQQESRKGDGQDQEGWDR